MVACSRDHVLDTGPTGVTGHTGTDGSSFSDRCSKYVELQGMSGENIAYGEKSAKEVVIQLLIDDGVSSRGHRANLLNPEFKKMSSFTGEHQLYG